MPFSLLISDVPEMIARLRSGGGCIVTESTAIPLGYVSPAGRRRVRRLVHNDRMHESLGDRPPAEFEDLYVAQGVD
jgi:transposase InsO family protein